eukprot:Selendium_serpulae@DN11647_c0_g1_i1.p1
MGSTMWDFISSWPADAGSRRPMGLCNGMKLYFSRDGASEKPIIIHSKDNLRAILRIQPVPGKREVLCSQGMDSSTKPWVCASSAEEGKISEVMIYIHGCQAYLTVDNIRAWDNYPVPKLRSSTPGKIFNGGGSTIEVGGVTSCYPAPPCSPTRGEDPHPQSMPLTGHHLVNAPVASGASTYDLDTGICDGMWIIASRTADNSFCSDAAMPDNIEQAVFCPEEYSERLHLTIGADTRTIEAKMEPNNNFLLCRQPDEPTTRILQCGRHLTPAHRT